MDNLKSAIADKVFEVSSLNETEMRAQLEKISRFRDFANACQVLMNKYPAIETELLRMVENNDFDTKIASTRVDTIIRLSESGALADQAKKADVAKDISTLEDITENVSSDTPGYSPEDGIYKEMEIKMPAYNTNEYIDFEEIKDYTGAPVLSEQAEDAHTDVEEDIEDETEEEMDETDITPYREPVIDQSPVKPHANQAKDTAKKGVQLVIAIVAIVAIILIIVFVIQNLETVLWGLGVILVLLAIIWMLLKRKKFTDEEE